MPKIPLLTPEELLKQRIIACQSEILVTLKKHNCLLDATVTISKNSIDPVVRIVPIKEELDIKNKPDTIKTT